MIISASTKISKIINSTNELICIIMDDTADYYTATSNEPQILEYCEYDEEEQFYTPKKEYYTEQKVPVRSSIIYQMNIINRTMNRRMMNGRN